MLKALLAQEAVGPNPTDREKNGSKRHLLVDGRSVPLSIIVTAANRHDVSQLAAVLDAIVVPRPLPRERRSQHLCADAGYTDIPACVIIETHGYMAHVKGRGQAAEEKRRHPTAQARRWMVEVAHSWFNRFRKLLVRYEKLERSFLGLTHLAAAIIVLRKVPLAKNIIYGKVLNEGLHIFLHRQEIKNSSSGFYVSKSILVSQRLVNQSRFKACNFRSKRG